MNKKNYIWNTLGTLSSSAISIVMLLLATRLLSTEQVDLFVFAYALAQQFYVLGYFQVRNFQSTDTNQTYPFESYLWTRIVTVFLMIVLSICYIYYAGYNQDKATVIFMLTLYRACEAFSDVYQGFFQQHARSDLAGKIQFIRSVLTLFIFGFTLLITEEIVLSSFLVFLVNFILVFPLDIAIKKREFSKYKTNILRINYLKFIIPICTSCFPLFINGYLITAVYNEPKLAIDSLLDLGLLESGVQRDFNVLFMPVFVLSLLFYIFRPFITQLSEHWSNGEQILFFKKVRNLFLLMTVLGLVGTVLGYILGTEILGFIYGLELSKHRLSLSILLLAGVLNVLTMIVDVVLTIFRKQKYLLVVYLISFLISKLATRYFISLSGILGAAQAFLIVMTTHLLFSIIVYIVVRKKHRSG